MTANLTEIISSWYLRFNGYFTTVNFTIHPDFRNRPGGSDADIIAVRFPFSVEYQRRFNFQRDQSLVLNGVQDFIIVEVKKGLADLNPSWRKPERGNVEYSLRWMGFSQDEALLNEVSSTLYERGGWRNETMSVRLLLIGSRVNESLKKNYPDAVQLELSHIARFLLERFTTSCEQIHRENWDAEIIEFANRCEKEESVESLMEWILQE